MPAQIEGCPVSKESIDFHLFRFVIKTIHYFHLLWFKAGPEEQKIVFCIHTQSAHSDIWSKCYNGPQQTPRKYHGWRRRHVRKDGFQDLLCNGDSLFNTIFPFQMKLKKVFLISIVLAKNSSAKSSENPIDDLHKWDDAEAKTKAKEAAEGGNEIHRTHPDAPLHF